MVEAAGMKGKVTYISFDATYLGYIKNYDATARLGYVRNDEDSQDYQLNATAIATAQALLTGENEVFIDSRTYTDTAVNMCKAAHLPMETWGICYDDTETAIVNLNPYISGVTSNKHNAGEVLFNNAVN